MRETVADVFLTLYPAYRPTSDGSCELSSIADSSIADDSSATFLFYSLAAKNLSTITLTILDDPRPNAYAIDSAHSASGASELFLTKGLLELMTSRAALAFVIAHEMAHLELDHFAPDFSLLVLTASQEQRVRRIHEDWELTADRRAAQILRKTGFDNREAIDFLRLLGSCGNPDVHENVLQAHPAIEDRIQSVEVAMSDLSSLG